MRCGLTRYGSGVNVGIIEASLELLRHRWRALLVIAAVALGPALAATSLIEAFGSQDVAIVNGSMVPGPGVSTWAQVALSAAVGDAQVRMTITPLVALAWFLALGVGLRVLAGAAPWAAARQVTSRLWGWLALDASSAYSSRSVCTGPYSWAPGSTSSVVRSPSSPD